MAKPRTACPDIVSRFLRAPRRVRGALAALALVATLTPACGKKGPPLAPYSSVPGGPPETTVRRKGDQVEIRFKVPIANSDGRQPAHVDRVEAYAATVDTTSPLPAGRQPATSAKAPPTLTPPMLVKRGKLVGAVSVREPPPPPPDVKEGDPPPPPPPPRTDPGLDQGMLAIIVDTLSPADLKPVPIPELEKALKQQQKESQKGTPPPDAPRLTPPDLGPNLPTPPLRYYVVVGRNGGDKGTPSQRFAVPIDTAPPAPPGPTVKVAEGHLELSWTVPEGLRRPILLTVAPPKAVAAPAGTSPIRPSDVEGGESDAGVHQDNPNDDDDDEEDRDVETRPPTSAGETAPQPPPAPPAAESTSPPTPATPVPASVTTPPAAGAPAGATPATTAQEATPTGVLPARLLSGFPNTTYTYAVYEVAPPGFQPPKQEEGAVPPYPALLTAAPSARTTWRDERFEVGVERCYAVRTVATNGNVALESGLSPPVCVKTVDVFPPSAPKKLEAVASEGAISLIWEASPEADVAGYIVLRGEASKGALAPLTARPIKESTYRDTKVKSGVRYVYAVMAVDKATPENVSAQSNRVEETAR